MVLYSIDEYETEGDFNRLSWGHALCDFGLAVSLIGSIMMACAQQSLPAAKAAAGRIVAKPPGYESLAANHRSASLQSRSTHCTQASPFEGRPSTPHISGPYPSPAAIAAVNAAVSPKQQRPASSAAGGAASSSSSASSPQQRKLSSPTPYPALGDPQASPSRRRKSSGQGKQFAGVYNHSKHPPLFASQHVQEEWRVQQSATWSEDMRVVEEEMGSDGVRKQRALKSQIEQHHGLQQHANTWSASANSGDRERSWAHSAYAEHHYDRDWRATSRSEQYGHPKMPPPPAPPSAVAPANYGNYGGPAREACYPGNPHQPADGGQALAGGYRYPGPVGYPSHPQWGPQYQHYQQQQQQHHQQQQRPDSGNFPDPPPPEQLLCYEEERPTETPSYHGYPNPIPGDDDVCVPFTQQAPVQPVVLYRAPSQPGQSPVTETVTIRPQDPYHAPQPRPTTPHGSPLVLTHIQQAQSPQHHHSPLHSQQQQHQTFPRQQPAHAPASPHSYSTFGR